MQPESTNIVIEPVAADRFAEVLELLAASALPQDGLHDHLATTLAARQGNRIVGCAALEVYGQVALLRSVAVDAALRGRGIGRQLTAAARGLARSRGVSQVYLLTETAPDFFARIGFRPVARQDVAPAVQQSVEFVSACPQTAQAMQLDLRPE